MQRKRVWKLYAPKCLDINSMEIEELGDKRKHLFYVLVFEFLTMIHVLLVYCKVI